MLQTSLMDGPLKLGLTPRTLAAMEKAAAGEPAALVDLAKLLLGAKSLLGEGGALIAAEVPAYLAAINGGESEQRFVADILEQQAAFIASNPDSTFAPDNRRLAMWQAASIYHDLGDGEQAERVLGALAGDGDAEAAEALKGAAE